MSHLLSYASAKKETKRSRVSDFAILLVKKERRKKVTSWQWRVNNNNNAWLKTTKNNNNNLTNETAHFLDFTFNQRTFAVEGRTTSCLPWHLDLAVGHSALRFVVVHAHNTRFYASELQDTEFPISRRPYTGGTRYGRHLTARLRLDIQTKVFSVPAIVSCLKRFLRRPASFIIDSQTLFLFFSSSRHCKTLSARSGVQSGW